jgi:DNA invertase Pin-like site-specific DNA recombinase
MKTGDMIPDSMEDLNKKLRGLIGDVVRRDDEESVAIYTRVSRLDKRHHGYSMEIQPDRSEEYAKTKGWTIYKIYEDPARTGRNSRRPSLQLMLKDIKAGRITIVVVHRLDRLYRNLESLLAFIRIIKSYKVRLVSVTEQIDTDNWWGRLVLYVLGALAEMYIWQSSARTREAKLERVMRGLSNGTYRFGYCNGLCSTCSDPNGSGYCPRSGMPDRAESQRGRVQVPHPIEMHAVRLAATLYSQKKSDLDIANILNSHKFQLPDGSVVVFRTKGLPGKSEPGYFSKDNIREIIRNPFYVGMVAHYPTRPLDMDDDPENRRRKKVSPVKNRRQPQVLQPGQHEPLYSHDLWEKNMSIRSAKGNTPTTTLNKRREYLLTGISRCWTCLKKAGNQVGFRGSTGGNGTQYYRCATLLEKSKKEKDASMFDDFSLKSSIQPQSSTNWDELIKSHSVSTLRASHMEEQVEEMMMSLVIPQEWYEMIAAYFLKDDELADFERESYNLRRELERLQSLFTDGFISKAKFQEQAIAITSELKKMEVMEQPEVKPILHYLKDFPKIWSLMTNNEKRAILRVVFEAIYFDDQAVVRRVSAHSPFDALLRMTPSSLN